MIGVFDIAISIFYILVIVAVGLWAGLKKKTVSANNTSNGYFLAGKTLKWPMIGLALFAANKPMPRTVLAGIPFMMMAFYLFISLLLV